MSTSMRTLAAACALLLSQPLSAQESRPAPEAEDSPEIVVTGERDIERRVRSFVGALTPALPSAQLPRFETAICPAVLGLGSTNGPAVERRLRQVAEAAGMSVAPQGCLVNVLLMVVDRDTRDAIETLRRRHIRYLGSLSLPAIRRLLREQGPAVSWQQTTSVTGRGSPNSNDGSEGQLGFLNNSTETPSWIVAPTRPVFEASALIVERRALGGLTPTQLADYAAMRLFAQIDPARVAGSAVPTILTILDAPMGSEVPVTLTEWDLGFLRGLYTSPPNLYAGAQRSEIAREIVQRIERRASEEN